MSLIGIKLEGDSDYLDTAPDTSIEITLENPILGDADKLSPGSYSMPFGLPAGEASPKNSSKLNHPDVIENNEAYQIKSALLFYDGILFKKGNLKASGGSGNKVDSYFTFGLGSLAADLKTARITEIISEEITIDNSALIKKIYVKHSTTGERSITVNGNSYSGSSWTAIVGAINTESETTLDSGKYVPRAQLVSSGANSPNGLTPEYIVIWASLYYTYHDPVLDMDFYLWQDSTDPFVELNITVESTDNFSFDHNLQTYLNSYSTFMAGYISGSYPTDKIRFPVFFNDNLYDKEQWKYSGLINGVSTAGLIQNDPRKSKDDNSLQPFLRLKWVLDKVATVFGFSWEGTFYTDPDTETRILDNSIALDVPQDYINRKFVFWRRSFNLNELVPDLLVIDFLKAIASRYNLSVVFNDATGKVNISFRESLALSTAYEDITPLCSPISGNEDQRIEGYTMICKKEDTDALSVDENITIGTAEKPIELTCGRIHATGTYYGKDSKLLHGPRVSRKIGDKFNLRIFHYKGLVSNGFISYPAADIHGANVYEGLSDYFGFIGIHNRYWKYWTLFLSNRRLIKLNVNWPLRMLLSFDWSMKRRFDRTNYLVKSIKMKMTNKALTVSDVELITMR